MVKRVVYDSLALTVPGPGYAHLPANRDIIWFEQLVSERCVMRKVNGIAVPRFELRSGHNEALDARVYARCVLEILRPNWHAIEDLFLRRRDEVKIKTQSTRPVERLAPEPVTTSSGPPKPPPAARPLQRPRRYWWR